MELQQNTTIFDSWLGWKTCIFSKLAGQCMDFLVLAQSASLLGGILNHASIGTQFFLEWQKCVLIARLDVCVCKIMAVLLYCIFCGTPCGLVLVQS